MHWSTGLAFGVMGEWVFKKRYFEAWSKAQEAKTVRYSRSELLSRFLEKVLKPLSPEVRVIILKDLKIFLRDTNQWSQLFLIAALIIIYIYNFSVLPLDRSPLPTFYLQNIIAFLNLGLAAFVIAAIAGRFTFPSISLEGKSFWILKSSPLELRTVLWSKFWINFFFLLVPAEILIIITNESHERCLLHEVAFGGYHGRDPVPFLASMFLESIFDRNKQLCIDNYQY